jgi:histone-lysine N-methyltransferase SETD2
VLVDKEKRGKSYTEGKLDSLSPEKQEKMKKFIKEYAHKILKKLKDKGKLLSQLQRQPGVSTPDTPASASQPRSVDDDAAMVRDMFEPNQEDEDDDVDMEADSSQRADDLAELGQTPDDGSVNASPVDALKMIADALAAEDRKAAFMTPPATEKLSAERTLS